MPTASEFRNYCADNSTDFPSKGEFISQPYANNYGATVCNFYNVIQKTNTMNNEGVVFPAAGYYNGTTMVDFGEVGAYWTNSPNDQRAYTIYIHKNGTVNENSFYRDSFAISVRCVLIKD